MADHPRRPRAPTITINTSDALEAQSIHDDEPPSPLPSRSAVSPTDVRSSHSFDSRDSRPTSPHNVSSPTQWGNPHSFLAVPTARSRAASIDAEVESASGSEGTYVNTPTPATEFPPKVSMDGSFFHQGAGDHPVLPDDQALEPDPGTEADFVRENNPFAYAPGHMTKLLNPKSLGAFHAMGGLAGLEKGLHTDRATGLGVDADNTERERIFSDNRLPERKPKSIFQLMWLAYNDKVLIVLTVAAVIALALGLYQTLGLNGHVEWVEGVAIIIAIIIVVAVGALNDFQKEKQFAKLNKKKESRNVRVVRSGKTQELGIHDVLVGDILLVETGDILPVDGIFISGHSVRCDESSATGESDLMKKTPADEVYEAMEANANLKKLDPFMISGAKVTEGFGHMLVTAVGIHSSYGKTMVGLQDANDMTPLQSKLNSLAEYIAKIGSAAAVLLFVILLIEFLAELRNNPSSPAEKGQQFVRILIVAVTIIVVAVPEGLPLAVTLALAYATRRMLKVNNLVRVLRSCETMGNATTVCSDKTGTLTQNVMTVVAGTIGTSNRFRHQPDSSAPLSKKDDVPAAEFVSTLADPVKLIWKDIIAVCSTAFESADGQFVGSKTETALLQFASEFLAMDKVQVERDNAQIVQLIPFDSGRKCMAVVTKLKHGFRLTIKGASEMMLRYSSQIVRDPTKSTDAVAITSDNRVTIEALIDDYASRSLRTIGFLYRDFNSEEWPPRGVKTVEDDRTQALFEDICRDMTFLGFVGIQDPLRPGVQEAVQDCKTAGVKVRMVTGDNILTAKAIATECGIWTPPSNANGNVGGLALEGPMFRKMSKSEQLAVIPKLQILARSSPDDKRVLVKRLKEMGETVAVTGDGTNDAPALKAADVGFSMNIAGTEVAKEASDIILMDDNFASIVNALMWGRAINDAVRKFLQFQITVNITAVLLAFISAVSSRDQSSVLTAVQLLWVNLIMDTMAALALATDPPSRKILNRNPDKKSAPLISVTMWKMIIGQAIYQLVVTLILYFAGAQIFDYEGDLERRQLSTLVFNTFVWMQIFNALNNRRLDNRFNVFEGIFQNLFFIGIFFIMIGGQVLIIFIGGWPVFQAERQTGSQWAIALVLGALSLPIGMVVRLIPDELAKQVVPEAARRRLTREKKVAGADDTEMSALDGIKEELAWLKKYKGGRLNNLTFKVAQRFHSHSRSSLSIHSGRSRSSSAVAGAVAAGLMAGSVGGVPTK